MKNLPKSLADVFSRALEQVIFQGRAEITQAILPWIVAAKQPLSLSQLEECCLIRVLQEYSIKDRYVNGIHLVDSWFQGLVEVDHETKTVHFIHSSVQRFFLMATTDPALQDFRVNMEVADRHVGEIIVTYLNFNDFKKTLTRQRQALPPISPEAICQQALGNEFSWFKFLFPGHGTRTADIDATIASCTKASPATLQEAIDMEHPFLLYASTHWLSHSFNFNQKDCLTWQTWKDMLMSGHELAASPVAEGHHQLIDEAFARWALSTRHCPLLYVVATSRDLNNIHRAMFDDVVRENNIQGLSLLIKTKTWGAELHFAFCTAARYGRVDVLKVLIEAGVDPNLMNPRSPLIEAIKSRQFETIQFLLREGASPVSPFHRYRNPLELAVALASCTGIQACEMRIKKQTGMDDEKSLGFDLKVPHCPTCEAEIRKLVHTNPNTSYIVGRGGGFTVGLGIEEPELETVNLLRSPAADVSRELRLGRKPLPRPCPDANLRLDIVKLLIQAGAELKGELGFSLLHKAVHGRNMKLIEVLLKEGASANRSLEFTSDEDTSPLLLAAKEGMFEIIKVLLDSGAVVESVCDFMFLIPWNLKYGQEYEELSRRLE